MHRNRTALSPSDDGCRIGFPTPPAAGTRLAPGWPLAGLALSQVGAGLPPAGYAHYRDRLGLSDAQVTALFAFLITGVMLVLWLCRREFAGVLRGPVLVSALAVAIAADVLFPAAGSYPVLALASVLLGCSVGAMCALVPGVVTALVADGARASSRVTAANAVGLAAGPILAGAVNQLLPGPYLLVYAVHAVACLVVAVPLRHAPAGSADGSRVDGRGRSGSWPGYRAAVTQGYLAFAVGGVVTSLAAVLTRDEFALTSRAAAGALITVFFAANATVGACVLARWAGRARRIGTLLLGTGLAAAALAVATTSPVLLAVAVVLAGAGQGAFIGAGIAVASRADGAWGGNTAVAMFFLWCYAGAVTAALTVGWISGVTGPGPAFLSELAVIVAGLAAIDLLEARSGRDG